MSQQLTFMMGEFPAVFPTDRQYAKNHMWAQPHDAHSHGASPHGSDSIDSNPIDERRYRFGFTTYAVRLLQDVYFLDWTIDEGTRLAERAEIGAIESKKAESDLFAPVAGSLAHFNATVLHDPALINVDTYERGWLFEMVSPGHNLLTPNEYVEHLEAVWEVTQRTIKGQLN